MDMKGVIDVLLTPVEIVEATHSLHLPKIPLTIRFENVSFKYKDRLILKDVSFKIEAGQTAVIIGPTGAGKSTVAKLLLRLFDPIEGNIFINDISLKELSLKSLSEAIGWVPQEGDHPKMGGRGIKPRLVCVFCANSYISICCCFKDFMKKLVNPVRRRISRTHY